MLKRTVLLCDLIAAWEIGVEVMLPVEKRVLIDITAKSKSRTYSEINASSIENLRHRSEIVLDLDVQPRTGRVPGKAASKRDTCVLGASS